MDAHEAPRRMESVFLSFPLWGPLRSALRFLALLIWMLACYIALKLGALLLIFSSKTRQSFRRALNSVWVGGFRYLMGLRIRTKGAVPSEPCFLVCNHISWVDYILMANLVRNCAIVLQAEDEHLPLAGALMASSDPIFNVRKREAVQESVKRMAGILRTGNRNLLLTPEGVVSPGKEVRRFHAALLEAAVLANKPVHYASITCRTPEGCPPASRVLLFGPDPYFLGPDGKIPQSEIDVWGPPRPFLPHLLALLALPWHEFSVRFAPDPITREDRIALAQALQAAVQDIFTPVE